MKRLFLFLLLASLASAPAWAGYVNGTTGVSSGGIGQVTVTFTYSPTATNQITLFLRYNGTAGVATPYCTDNNYNSLLQGVAIAGANDSEQPFYGIAASGATVYTCTYNGSNISGVLGEYTGFLSFNPLLSGNTALGTGTLASATVTTDDANDYVVCGFGDESNGFQGAYTGTERKLEGTAPTSVLVDNTSATAGSVTVAANISGSVAWKGACLELRTVSTSPIFTLIQENTSGYTGGASCNNLSALCCAFPVATVGSGHALVLEAGDHFDGVTVQHTLTSVSDCVTLTSNTCGSSINTWVLPGSPVQAYTTATGVTQAQDAAYVLSSTSGANFIYACRSAESGSTNRWALTLFEVAASSGTIVLDTLAESNDGGNSGTVHSITESLITGTNDFIVQGFTGPGPNVTVTAPYYNTIAFQHLAYSIALNVSNGTAPTWTGTANSTAAGNALAFTNSPPSGPSISGITPGTQLTPGTQVTP
jgi:hypothetical protein